MIGSRTRSREIALQALFSYDVEGKRDRATLTETLAHAEASEEVRAFAQQLVDGVLEHLEELDGHIAGAADNWVLERLATVDRNVLRLAIHEMADRDDVPVRVAIDEAIELGKRYSTAQSGAFINGILDRIRKDLGLPIDGGADIEEG